MNIQYFKTLKIKNPITYRLLFLYSIISFLAILLILTGICERLYFIAFICGTPFFPTYFFFANFLTAPAGAIFDSVLFLISFIIQAFIILKIGLIFEKITSGIKSSPGRFLVVFLLFVFIYLASFIGTLFLLSILTPVKF